MIDENSQFYAILTNVGMAKQANADALGVPWKITEMGVGDANGTDPTPSAAQTRLINEWRRRPLNQLKIDPTNSAVIIAEQIIPADEGGKWIREIGLYDADGDLVAVANCAPSFKPVLAQGSGRTQVVRMNLIVSSTGNVTLKIDPSVVLATREFVMAWVADEINKLDRKQSVRAATTANIVLVGTQVIDGVAILAGDRVLVKNQTSAKDNGVYIAAVGAWARAKDADNNAEVTPNMMVAIEVGSIQADTLWQLITDGSIVVGTTALTFQDVTAGFARLLSPGFSGTPTAPTPAQFDNSKLLATAEFVKRSGIEYSSFSSNSANLALTAAHVGGLHSFSNAALLTVKSWWGEGYAGVCLKPYQFSCWNKNDPNYPYLSGAKDIPPKQFAQAQRAADLVISGAEADITRGATHYYATTMPKPPAWAKGATQTLRLGNHVFFKDVP